MALQRNVPFSPSLIVWSRGVVVKLRGTVKVDIKMFLKGKRFPFGVNKQLVLYQLRYAIGLNSRHFFIQSEVKPTPIVTLSHSFSRPLRQLHVIASCFDWVTVLPVSFAID